MFHHSPVGVLQLAGLLERDDAGQGLQDLLKGLQVHRQLLHRAGSRSRDLSLKPHQQFPLMIFHPHTQLPTYLLVNVLDQELTELQSFHHLLLHHLALSFTDLLKTLRETHTGVRLPSMLALSSADPVTATHL